MVVAKTPRTPRRSRWSASSAPTSSPRSIRQPCIGRDGHRAAIGVGVVGDHDVGVVLGGQRHGEVHRARLLGIRERHGREVGIGLGLLGHDDRRREPGQLPAPVSTVSSPTPCSGV